METGGSGVAGLRDTAGRRSCSQRAPGLLAAPPAPRHWLARGGGSSREVGSNCLSGPFLSGVNGWNSRALEAGERSQTAAREEARRRCPGGRLGAQGRKCPRRGSLNTRPRPEGRAASRKEGAGSSPQLRCPEERRTRSHSPVFSAPHVPLQVRQGVRLTNSRAGDRRAGRGGGPTGVGPPRSQ